MEGWIPDDPIYRRLVFKPAEPLEEHVLQSIAFLKRVESVKLTGGDKQTFQFTVSLLADPMDKTSKPSSFEITRTPEDVDRVSKIAYDACCRHVTLNKDTYHIPTCELCKPFNVKVKLPLTTKDRLFLSTQKIHTAIEERVAALVRGAVVPPTNPTLFCEGVTRLPSAVAKFLLLGVDQSNL